MSTVAATARILTVALIGNPNTGKSTLFNALSGFRTLTGNYPGVTVEKKLGETTCGDQRVRLVDLPGTYSLAPRTLDEMVAVNVLLGRQDDVGTPDVVVCIVDASNLERNLYLVSQVLDLGLPTVVALNMADVAASRGITIDVPALAGRLGLPVVFTQAHRKQGMDELRQAILEAARRGAVPRPRVFPPAFAEECNRLQARLGEMGRPETPYYLLERLLLDIGGYLEGHFLNGDTAALREHLFAARGRLGDQGCKVPAIEARVRYQWVRETLEGLVRRPATRPVTFSDRLDRFLTHRISGLAAFAILMFLVFQALYSWATPLMDLCEAAQEAIGGAVAGIIPPGPLQSLLVDGVIGGVGSVLVFLPQIVILFFFIALLEDCGYMARAAFLMDRLMTKVGLSGKSFVPLMSSFACAIPGVMATRVIENRRDRMTTILVAPLMSCSARQPVYALLIAAFIPATAYLGNWITLQGLVLFGMTFLGAAIAVPIAWLFKKTLFKGETPPFVMELPTYKWPSPRIVLHRVYESGKSFVTRAGTLIFATNVLVWAAGYFPGDHAPVIGLQREIEGQEGELAADLEAAARLQVRHAALADRLAGEPASPGPFAVALRALGFNAPADADEPAVDARDAEIQLRQIDDELSAISERLKPLEALRSRRNQLQGDLLEKSLLGRLGHAVEPVVKPLGWDWRIGVGALASFPAREVIVGTLGTIYSLGGADDPRDSGLQSAIQAARWPDGTRVYNVPVALSIMVFFALCAQCASTLMVIRRETNSLWWPTFTFLYMTGLAYLGAWIAYRAGLLLFSSSIS
jgi:ferrous iron transport protein B